MKRSVTSLIQTEVMTKGLGDVARAATILRAGGLLAFATETVYGLGADARNDHAVARIYEAKGRPSFNPLIVHVGSTKAAKDIVEFNDHAEKLAAAFWPGALTLVLPIRKDAGISRLVTAGLDTLAVRLPNHTLAQRLLEMSGIPVAAPSANPSGRISPTTAAHVVAGLSGRIEAVLDGGACPVGVESTIISCAGAPVSLRSGGVPLEVIEACLGAPLAHDEDAETPTAPGQLASHYAPQGTVRLNVEFPSDGETLLGFGAVEATYSLSRSGDLVEAAANLFDCLHQLDEAGVTQIAVSPIPNNGLGAAINDRLKRAAAPRP